MFFRGGRSHYWPMNNNHKLLFCSFWMWVITLLSFRVSPPAELPVRCFLQERAQMKELFELVRFCPHSGHLFTCGSVALTVALKQTHLCIIMGSPTGIKTQSMCPQSVCAAFLTFSLYLKCHFASRWLIHQFSKHILSYSSAPKCVTVRRSDLQR